MMWRQMVAKVCAESNEVPLETNQALLAQRSRANPPLISPESIRLKTATGRHGRTVSLSGADMDLAAEVKAHVDLVSCNKGNRLD